MSEETTIYESKDIKITNLRAVFGEKTYSVSNITSVETKKIDSGNGGIGCLFLIGAGSLIYALSNFRDNWVWLLIAVVLIVLAFFANKMQKPTYSVSLTTASGEVKAYESADQELIRTIVNALNDAIIKKG